MEHRTVLALLAVAMVVTIVAVDVLALRHHTALRLVVNIAIVLTAGAVWARFLR